MAAGGASRGARVVGAGVAALLVLAGPVLAVPTAAATAPPSTASAPGCVAGVDTVDELLACVTLEDVRGHLQALQGIADAHGGTRASGTPGYDASAEYVAARARDAGLQVSTQVVEFPFFEVGAAAFAQLTPTPTDYADGTDFTTATFSGAGDVTAAAVPVDLQLPPTGGSTSGCEPADFAGFPPGAVALMQRGTCEFGVKAGNAAAAGAAGAVIFNEGNAPDRVGLLEGSLGAPIAIPVVGTTFAIGQALPGAQVRLRVDAVSEQRRTTNVIAETGAAVAGGPVLVVGAHLDSVTEGPGINDNGSGSAATLAVATSIGSGPAVRFAWWGAEELGLLGSTYYVASLPPAERERIVGYLNFDMVGSPNPVRFVYDGDDSDAEGAGPGPAGSAAIEDAFEAFYADRGLRYQGTDFDGRSDYGPFIEAGVPAGGLFTGAEEAKTAEQAAGYGGRAGSAYDPCYHQACDTIANIDDAVLEQNADAVAYATLVLAPRT